MYTYNRKPMHDVLS